jgi:prepilin-type processing-associated H-X9-DG protein
VRQPAGGHRRPARQKRRRDLPVSQKRRPPAMPVVRRRGEPRREPATATISGSPATGPTTREPTTCSAPASEAQIARPADTIVFGDAGNRTDPAAATPPAMKLVGTVRETIILQPPSSWCYPGYGCTSSEDFRHMGLANFVFADGHAKPIKREAFVQELPPAERDPGPRPPLRRRPAHDPRLTGIREGRQYGAPPFRQHWSHRPLVQSMWDRFYPAERGSTSWCRVFSALKPHGRTATSNSSPNSSPSVSRAATPGGNPQDPHPGAVRRVGKGRRPDAAAPPLAGDQHAVVPEPGAAGGDSLRPTISACATRPVRGSGSCCPRPWARCWFRAG